MFERILVPLDGSATAEAVLPAVRRLLRRCDAEVLLFQAVSLYPQPDLDYSGIAVALRNEAEEYIRKYEAHLSAQGVRVRGLVRLGSEADSILEAAEHEGATMIAMATHGRSGLARLVFGSVADRVLRASPIPVFVVRSIPAEEAAPAPPTDSDTTPFQRILLPLDGHEPSAPILHDVTEFARLFNSRVRLLHVIESGGELAFTELRLRAAAETLEAAGVACDTMLRRGDPAPEILATAREDGAELIAMAAHGRSALSRLVLGSVTEKVLHSARVPLLVRSASRLAEVTSGAAGAGPARRV